MRPGLVAALLVAVAAPFAIPHAALAQSPAGGQRADVGSTISITVGRAEVLPPTTASTTTTTTEPDQ